MFVVTGGAGFIGSCLVAELNSIGIHEIYIVDDLKNGSKWLNLRRRRFLDVIPKKEFPQLLEKKSLGHIDGIAHLGACSATTERNVDYLLENNYRYTLNLLKWACNHNIRFVYASSAATYGDGAAGFDDDPALIPGLLPLNPYGWSKQLVDMWILEKNLQDRVCGLKYYNIFGPNEYHKGDMRSMVHKAWQQIKSTGRVSLFKSYRPEYPDGGQMRDFYYVKEAARLTANLLVQNRQVCGIYNVGSGTAHTWLDLINPIFKALNLEPQIDYVEMPAELRSQYQYYTRAGMERLGRQLNLGNGDNLEAWVTDYVTNYLEKPDPYL